MLKEMATPEKKADWVGRWLRIKVPFLPDKISDSAKDELEHVWVRRRMNAKETANSGQDVSGWGAVRVLKCQWRCPTCSAWHTVYIPESWVAEGKAVFMEIVAG